MLTKRFLNDDLTYTVVHTQYTHTHTYTHARTRTHIHTHTFSYSVSLVASYLKAYVIAFFTTCTYCFHVVYKLHIYACDTCINPS